MKEIKIFIPKELKIDLENSNENEIYIIYDNENLITIKDVTYEFVEDDYSCSKCEIPRNYECGDIKCTPSQRKDKKEGYFKIIKHINKTC